MNYQEQQPVSTLGAVASGAVPPPETPSQPVQVGITQAAPAPPTPTAPAAPKPQGSRLSAIISAVANVASTAMQGVPDRGRPSFVGGLGEGARAEQQAIQQQQAIKFKDLDTQIRLTQLHAQDQKLQLDTQAQTDAHNVAELNMRKMANDLGLDYDTIANHGPAVMDHLTAQTAANGAASIPAGTHVSADGQSIYIPKDPDSQKTRDAQRQMYNALAPALGLPPLPQGAVLLPAKNMDMLTNKINGFGLDGTPIKHDILPEFISAAQVQRDNLAKNGGTPQQLKTLDNVLAIYKANLDALDTHAAGVKQQTKTAELAAENSPEAIAGAAKKAAAVSGATLPDKLKVAQAKADIATATKTANDKNMYVGSDANGTQIAGTADDLKAAGASGITKLDADSGKKVITARQLVSPEGLFALIKQDMLNLDAKGKMGSSATARFNDALLQKAGSDPDYAPLFVHTHLLATALMQAHVGSKGSTDMMEEFKSLANSGKMSAATLRSSLGAEYNYVKEKAMLPKKQAAGGQ